MRTSTINCKSITSTMRFDGKFHLSDGLLVRKVIDKSPLGVQTIGDITSSIYCPGIFHRNYVKSGTPFLGGGDILKADYDSGKYLRKTTTPNHEILAVKRGWTVVTCGGTIGETAFVNNLLAKCWLSQHVMRVIPKDYPEGMLYAYLTSKFGKQLLTTNVYGSVIPTLNSSNIAEVPIPNFPLSFQTEVDDLIQESARLREEATDALEEAKKKLLEFINIDFKETSGFKTAKRKIKDVLSSLQCRLDPPALMNNSIEVFENNKHRTKTIGEFELKVWYPGMFKRTYVKNGLPYMQGSSVFETNPFTRCVLLSRTKTPKLNELWLKDGMILITCAGSCGQIKLITKEYEDKEAIGSPDIIRIFSDDKLITNEFLFVYLQLPLVQDYMQGFKYGSVIERFDATRVQSVPVILPTEAVSAEITSIIKRYKDYTYEAFCKEERAIQMVEQEISKWNN